MYAIVVYESMYGNTHRVAEAIARGLEVAGTVRTVPISMAGDLHPSEYDLLVVGGPTHAHGMSRKSTRHGADDAAANSNGTLTMEPGATSNGVRDWLSTLSGMSGRAASFDTRFNAAALLTGRASKGIARSMREAGFTLIAEPESFLVDKDTKLLSGEEERAKAWGESLASTLRQS